MTREHIQAAAEDIDTAYEALRGLGFTQESAVKLVGLVLMHADKRSTL